MIRERRAVPAEAPPTARPESQDDVRDGEWSFGTANDHRWLPSPGRFALVRFLEDQLDVGAHSNGDRHDFISRVLRRGLPGLCDFVHALAGFLPFLNGLHEVAHVLDEFT